jgi:hypothetical protein
MLSLVFIYLMVWGCWENNLYFLDICFVLFLCLCYMLSFTICVFILRCFSYWQLACWLSTLINKNWIDLNWNNRSLKTYYWMFVRFPSEACKLMQDPWRLHAYFFSTCEPWPSEPKINHTYFNNSLIVPHRLMCKESAFCDKEHSKIFIFAQFQSRSR